MSLPWQARLSHRSDVQKALDRIGRDHVYMGGSRVVNNDEGRLVWVGGDKVVEDVSDKGGVVNVLNMCMEAVSSVKAAASNRFARVLQEIDTNLGKVFYSLSITRVR